MEPYKRSRTAASASEVHQPVVTTNRIPLLRFPNALCKKLDRRYCSEDEIVQLLMSHKLCELIDDETFSENGTGSDAVGSPSKAPPSKAAGKRVREERPSRTIGLWNARQSQLNFRLSGEFASNIWALDRDIPQECTEEAIVPMLLRADMCSRAMTFEVKVTQMGDLNTWIGIILDDQHATSVDLKEGVERATGICPAMQELFKYENTWTGTEASGGTGHTAAQEEQAFIPDDFMFDGPCSLLVLVNEAIDIVLEGQESGESNHHHMGVYERLEGESNKDRGVWRAQGSYNNFGCGVFLYFNGECWCVGDGEGLKCPETENIWLKAESEAQTPDKITGTWEYIGQDGEASARWMKAPKVRTRVCNSVEKYAEAEKMQDRSMFRCPHQMVVFIAQLPYGCDQCGKHLSRGAEVRGCRKCNFDLCETCFSKSGPE
jgi:hypothetical protein